LAPHEDRPSAVPLVVAFVDSGFGIAFPVSDGIGIAVWNDEEGSLSPGTLSLPFATVGTMSGGALDDGTGVILATDALSRMTVAVALPGEGDPIVVEITSDTVVTDGAAAIAVAR
jgi:hypothetical protein